MPVDRNDAVVSLSKRRGFVYPSSEIYGGTRSAWDYGPLGVELKENVRRQWWRAMVSRREDVVGLDSAVILATEVWEASGHLAEFVDPLTECLSCHKRFRADHLEEAYEAKHGRPPTDLAEVNCPNCGVKGQFTEPKMFNGLLKTYLGPVEDEDGLHYLRPETAQGIFINYKNVATSSRKKPPFGIGQIGKSFRNEITPGNFIFRTREFEQMEMEFFVEPGTDEKWHEYWIEERWDWYTRPRPQPGRTCASSSTRRRSSRTTRSGRSTSSTGSASAAASSPSSRASPTAPTSTSPRTRSTPASTCPTSTRRPTSAGRRTSSSPRPGSTGRCWRSCSTRTPRTRRPTPRACWRSARCCGWTAGSPRSRSRCCRCRATPTSRPRPATWPTELRKRWNVEFDDAGAIGRRYRRQDEIGTPFCVTVDFDTLEDGAATVRERDTMAQERVALDQLAAYLAARLIGC